MGKVIGIVLVVVVLIAAVFIFSGRISENTTFNSKIQKSSHNVQKELDNISDSLKDEYPATPDEVINTHNQLMKVLYNPAATEKNIDDYVMAIRKLYSKELLAMNTVEDQVATLTKEKSDDATNQLEIITNEIKKTYIVKDNEGNDTSAEINVLHLTNQGSINRTYFLVMEDGKWKINSWLNTNTETDPKINSQTDNTTDTNSNTTNSN